MLISVGVQYILTPSTYLTDAYTDYSASAIAASTVLRSLFSAFLPLVGPSMYERLSLGWGNSLLAFIALAFGGVPARFYRYGQRWKGGYKVDAVEAQWPSIGDLDFGDFSTYETIKRRAIDISQMMLSYLHSQTYANLVNRTLQRHSQHNHFRDSHIRIRCFVVDYRPSALKHYFMAYLVLLRYEYLRLYYDKHKN
ncbi:MAG: hypothetical protein Q9217_003792 [Psora testacea]